MERINKTIRKLKSIPELDTFKEALYEHDKLAADSPVTIQGLAEGIAKAQIKALDEHIADDAEFPGYCPLCGPLTPSDLEKHGAGYTLARLQEEDVLDEARELLAKYERDRERDEDDFKGNR
jgi:hypothetical protein